MTSFLNKLYGYAGEQNCQVLIKNRKVREREMRKTIANIAESAFLLNQQQNTERPKSKWSVAPNCEFMNVEKCGPENQKSSFSGEAMPGGKPETQ